MTHTLDTRRDYPISWLSPLGIVLIGGDNIGIRNAQLLNGTILFTIDRRLRDACSIGLMETVVVTGGGNVHSQPTVEVYNTSGMVEQLPDMRTPRREHACGHYVDSNNHVVNWCHRQPAFNVKSGEFYTIFRFIW